MTANLLISPSILSEGEDEGGPLHVGSQKWKWLQRDAGRIQPSRAIIQFSAWIGALAQIE